MSDTKQEPGVNEAANTYLWWGGKMGWQVTSFHPSADSAINWPKDGDVRVYYSEEKFLKVWNENVDMSERIAELERQIERCCEIAERDGADYSALKNKLDIAIKAPEKYVNIGAYNVEIDLFCNFAAREALEKLK